MVVAPGNDLDLSLILDTSYRLSILGMSDKNLWTPKKSFTRNLNLVCFILASGQGFIILSIC